MGSLVCGDDGGRNILKCVGKLVVVSVLLLSCHIADRRENAKVIFFCNVFYV